MVGDMWLTSDQLATLESEEKVIEEEHSGSPGLNNRRYRWPNNIVYYQLANTFTSKDKTIIDDALASFEEKLDLCISFRKTYSGGRVYVRQNNRCSSSIG